MENLSKNERLKQAKEEIKAKLVRTLHELTEQYCTKEKQLYPDSAHLIHQSLVEVMGEYEYQVGKSLFTPRQMDKAREYFGFIDDATYGSFKRLAMYGTHKTYEFMENECKYIIDQLKGSQDGWKNSD